MNKCPHVVSLLCPSRDDGRRRQRSSTGRISRERDARRLLQKHVIQRRQILRLQHKATAVKHAQRDGLGANIASICLRTVTASLPASISTSLQRTATPWATSRTSLTRCASPIGSAPSLRLVCAGISLPHTV